MPLFANCEARTVSDARPQGLQGKLMRSSGLEPPRAVKPTRPSTLYTGARWLQKRPNRPNNGVSRTHRTHLEERVLPRCCHRRPDLSSGSEASEASVFGCSVRVPF
jgi:hypothetical protein